MKWRLSVINQTTLLSKKYVSCCEFNFSPSHVVTWQELRSKLIPVSSISIVWKDCMRITVILRIIIYVNLFYEFHVTYIINDITYI